MRSIVFIFLLSFLLNVLNAQDTASVNTWFIGSHGYLLESSTKKVALDCHIYWEGSNYGYIKPPVAVKSMIETAQAPFNNIDLLLISHIHSDHFNSLMVEKSMNLNPDAVIVTIQEVADKIASEADNYSSFSDRVWVPKLNDYKSKDTIIHGIPLTTTLIQHGSEPLPLQVYAFELDTIKFVQLNGWNSITAEMYDTLGFNKTQADVAFLGYSTIMDQAKYTKFDQKMHPEFSAISHIDGASAYRIADIYAKIEEIGDAHRMNLIYHPMEQIRYLKTADSLIVDTLNMAPAAQGTIPGFELNINEAWEYNLPTDLFIDWKSDSLIYSANLTNGDALPDWITFDASSMSFSGTPAEAQSINIALTATDTLAAEASLSFQLKVLDPNALNNPFKNTWNIFPNPATYKIYVDYSAEYTQVSVRLLNLLGQTMLNGELKEEGIDISGMEPGSYILQILLPDTELSFPLTIN